MSNAVFFAVIAALVVATICVIGWGLLGPRRPSDEAGHHVELAEQTRQRDLARQAGREPDGTGTEDERSG